MQMINELKPLTPVTTKCQTSTIVDRLNRTLRCMKGETVSPDVFIKPKSKCAPFMSYRCEKCGCNSFPPPAWYTCGRGGSPYIVGWSIIGSCAIARISNLTGGNYENCPQGEFSIPQIINGQLGCNSGYTLENPIGRPRRCKCNSWIVGNNNPCSGTDVPQPIGYSVPGCLKFGKILSYSKPLERNSICFDFPTN